MAQTGAQKEVSQQDATVLFLSCLQEHLAKSNFADGIKSAESSTSPTSSSSSSASTTSASSAQTPENRSMAPPLAMGMKRQRQEGARITRLRPPREVK